MKKETIIALIDEYVGSLDDNEKEVYEHYFELSNREGEPIKDLFKNGRLSLGNLAQIVQELERELKEESLKQSKGGSYLKRSKFVAKLLSKCYNDKWKNGFFEEINGEKMQCCVIDAIYGFAFRNPLDIPINDFPPCTLKNILPDYNNFEKCEFDIADIKAQLKLHKAKKDKTPLKIQIGLKFYNAQYFINCVDGLGGDITLYQNPKVTGIDVFEIENGIAILAPLRP